VRYRLHEMKTSPALRAVIIVAILVVVSLLFTNYFVRDDPPANFNMTTGERPAVGFLTGHGERAIGTQYRSVAAALEGNYEVREVNLADDTSALAEISTLVVAGAPDVPDAELFEIDQFLMRGGRAIFLLDGTVIAPGTTRGQADQVNIFDFVRSYGFTVNSDLVLDEVGADVPFRSGDTTGAITYPYWPRVVPPNLSSGHPVISDLDAVVFTWTSSVAISDEMSGGLETTILAGSSGRSWTVPAESDLDPGQTFVPPGDDAAEIRAGIGPSYPLAVAVTGEFTSAFAGKPVIVEDGEGGVEFTEPPDAIDRGLETQIIVIGNARMFEDVLLVQNPSNLVLFVNAIDWLTSPTH